MPTRRLPFATQLFTITTIPLAAGFIGCASQSHRDTLETASARQVAPARALSSRSVIDGATLATVGAGNVYEALLRLRPEVLYRVAMTVDAPAGATRVVYVDGRLRGDTRELRQLPVNEVLELRLLTPIETAVRFGKKPVVGAIAITSR